MLLSYCRMAVVFVLRSSNAPLKAEGFHNHSNQAACEFLGAERHMDTSVDVLLHIRR